MTKRYFEIDIEDYYVPEQRKSRQSAQGGNYDVQCNYLGDMPYSVARSKVENSIRKIGCKVVELDGMLPVSRNLDIIQEYLL